MNVTDVVTTCAQVLPILPISEVSESVWKQSLFHQYVGCQDLEVFITKTVPCPPSWNRCLFWNVANKTNLSEEDLNLVQQACTIPNHSDCQNTLLGTSHSVHPGACDTTCIVILCLFIAVITILGLLLWKFRSRIYQKLPPSCNGVCVCFDKVLIHKNGIKRTESRSPTLENGGREEKRKSSLDKAYMYDNKAVAFDFKNERADYYQPKVNDDGITSEDGGDYVDLAPHENIQLQLCPDVTMVTESHVTMAIQPDEGKRSNRALSYC